MLLQPEFQVFGTPSHDDALESERDGDLDEEETPC
jgi:hypothetical protein